MKKLLFILLFAFTNLAGAPVKVLQVEESHNGYRPDPLALPSVAIIDANPAYEPGQYSGHATDVARRLCASGFVTELEIDHASFYYGRQGLGVGFSNYDPAKPTYPKPVRGWRVENHSYGRMLTMGMPQALARMDERIARDNVVVVVGVPNAGQGYATIYDQPAPRLLYSGAKNVITVASYTGNVEVLPGGRVDLVTHEEYSSYGTPVVAAVCVEMVSLALDAGYAYTWREVRDVLMQTADPKGDAAIYGAGVMNRDRAIEAWRKRITPQEKPQPPPVLVRGQCEATTLAGTRCKRTVTAGAHFCWQHNK